MSSQQLVGLAGGALIITNLWTGPQHDALAPLWSGTGDLSGAHKVAKQVGSEVLGVGVLAVAAGTSTTASRTTLALVAALWVLWLIHRGGNLHRLNPAADPFRNPGTVSPPVPTGPPVGSGQNPTGGGVPYSRQIPGLPPIPGMPYPSK